MMALQLLLEFAKETLPTWQSDALRRIWQKRDLDDNDINELEAMALFAHGYQIDGVSVQSPKPLSEEHLPTIKSTGQPISLVRIAEIENVNRLIAKANIEFAAPRGLTIVYGNNATGKTGFSRIIRKACHARGHSDPILPNIYAEERSDSPPTARFEITAGEDTIESVEWTDEASSDERLRSIVVFDTEAARAIVADDNTIEYIPYGSETLLDLAGIVDRVRDKVRQRLETLPKIPDWLPDVVGPGFPLEELTEETSIEEIEVAANFTGEDATRLNELEEARANLLINDPQKKKRQAEQAAKRVFQFRETICQIHRSLGRRYLLRLKIACEERAKALKDLSNLKDKSLQGALNGTGSALWRNMFEAARKYSVALAYPDEEFPFVGDSSCCVLCQQLLSDQAKTRMSAFRMLLDSTISNRITELEDVIDVGRESIEGLDTKLELLGKTTLEEIEDAAPGTIRNVEHFLEFTDRLIDSIVPRLREYKLLEVPNIQRLAVGGIRSLYRKRLAEAAAFEVLDVARELESIEAKRKPLLAKQTLARGRKSLFEYHAGLVSAKQLQACIREANTGPITRRQTDILEVLVSERVSDALLDELNVLRAERIPLSLKRRGAKGTRRHKVELKTRTSVSFKPDQVLSEGEQRIVALAAFLAELRVAPTCSGIVFDDPMRSLDHVFRERVAHRLCEEAKSRQVIVFTHMISFVRDLLNSSEVCGLQPKIQTVLVSAQGCGHCKDGPLRQMGRVGDRLHEIEKKVAEAKRSFESGDVTEYLTLVRDVFFSLYEAWERAIEEGLFNDVLTRFGSEISPLRLREVAVENELYDLLNEGMANCNVYRHDQHDDQPLQAPEPKELRQELERLRQFMQRCKEKRREYNSRRST